MLSNIETSLERIAESLGIIAERLDEEKAERDSFVVKPRVVKKETKDEERDEPPVDKKEALRRYFKENKYNVVYELYDGGYYDLFDWDFAIDKLIVVKEAFTGDETIDYYLIRQAIMNREYEEAVTMCRTPYDPDFKKRMILNFTQAIAEGSRLIKRDREDEKRREAINDTFEP